MKQKHEENQSCVKNLSGVYLETDFPVVSENQLGIKPLLIIRFIINPKLINQFY